MKALIYLTKKTFVNQLKKAVKKPTTVLALIFGIAYGIFILFSFGVMAVSFRLSSVQGLVIIISVWTIYTMSANMIVYASRKGIIFKPAHSQFVFTAPIDPKLVLIYGGWKNFLSSIGVWIVLCIGGFTVFQVDWWRVIFFFLTGYVCEIVLELAIILFLYTNDHFSEKFMKGMRFTLKAFLLIFTIVILFYFKLNGLSVESAVQFFDWPVLQMIPLIGWQVAISRLILLGPTVLNVVCTFLYLVFLLYAVVAVKKMKCNGGYYEEAAKFADDYAELKKKQKSGDMEASINGKKRKFRTVGYKVSGTGAKAIFSRQFLEYKKEKYFIFTKTTIITAVFAFIFSYSLREVVNETGFSGMFLLGIVAYISLIMSGYTGKWEKELKNPYMFMIPDSPLKKMWYATLMEHVKAFVDGCIICIPIGLFWGVSLIHVIYCILLYVVIQADRLYTLVIVQSLVGDVFGRTGQSLLRMFLQLLLIGTGVGVSIVAAIFLSVDLIYPIILGYMILLTIAMGALAALRFEVMESLV